MAAGMNLRLFLEKAEVVDSEGKTMYECTIKAIIRPQDMAVFTSLLGEGGDFTVVGTLPESAEDMVSA